MGYLTLGLSGSSFNNCTLNFRESMNHANLESECNFCCFYCLLILDDLFLEVTFLSFFSFCYYKWTFENRDFGTCNFIKVRTSNLE